jgi:DNA-binding NarL/FixJ family response regulator
MSTKILLADDHNLIREGLRTLISDEANMSVIAEAEEGRTAVQLADKLSPDVVIMDITMPGLNGIEATRQILSKNPAPKVIALSMHTDRRMILEMLNAGASGYLLKDCAFGEVIRAIETVMSNCTYLSPRIADIIVKDYIHRIPPDDLSSLTLLSPREREVLQLLAEGRKTRDIASLLHVSAKTVDNYRTQIMEKLGIYSIAELTKYAIREGLTSI